MSVYDRYLHIETKDHNLGLKQFIESIKREVVELQKKLSNGSEEEKVRTEKSIKFGNWLVLMLEEVPFSSPDVFNQIVCYALGGQKLYSFKQLQSFVQQLNSFNFFDDLNVIMQNKSPVYITNPTDRLNRGINPLGLCILERIVNKNGFEIAVFTASVIQVIENYQQNILTRSGKMYFETSETLKWISSNLGIAPYLGVCYALSLNNQDNITQKIPNPESVIPQQDYQRLIRNDIGVIPGYPTRNTSQEFTDRKTILAEEIFSKIELELQSLESSCDRIQQLLTQIYTLPVDTLRNLNDGSLPGRISRHNTRFMQKKLEGETDSFANYLTNKQLREQRESSRRELNQQFTVEHLIQQLSQEIHQLLIRIKKGLIIANPIPQPQSDERFSEVAKASRVSFFATLNTIIEGIFINGEEIVTTAKRNPDSTLSLAYFDLFSNSGPYTNIQSYNERKARLERFQADTIKYSIIPWILFLKEQRIPLESFQHFIEILFNPKNFVPIETLLSLQLPISADASLIEGEKRKFEVRAKNLDRKIFSLFQRAEDLKSASQEEDANLRVYSSEGSYNLLLRYPFFGNGEIDRCVVLGKFEGELPPALKQLCVFSINEITLDIYAGKLSFAPKSDIFNILQSLNIDQLPDHWFFQTRVVDQKEPENLQTLKIGKLYCRFNANRGIIPIPLGCRIIAAWGTNTSLTILEHDRLGTYKVENRNTSSAGQLHLILEPYNTTEGWRNNSDSITCDFIEAISSATEQLASEPHNIVQLNSQTPPSFNSEEYRTYCFQKLQQMHTDGLINSVAYQQLLRLEVDQVAESTRLSEIAENIIAIVKQSKKGSNKIPYNYNGIQTTGNFEDDAYQSIHQLLEKNGKGGVCKDSCIALAYIFMVLGYQVTTIGLNLPIMDKDKVEVTNHDAHIILHVTNPKNGERLILETTKIFTGGFGNFQQRLARLVKKNKL